MAKRFGLVLILFGMTIAELVAWGQEGHAIIGAIAELNLPKTTLAKVAAILKPGETLSKVSHWADDVRRQRRKTASWHYVDIPVTKPVTLATIASYYPKAPEAVVYQIPLQWAILRDSKASDNDRREALMFLVHLVGDIHQPLHCADDSDRGGNEKLVHIGGKGRQMKLHSLWDNLVDVADVAAYAAKLNGRLTDKQRQAWVVTNWDTVVWESYSIAKAKIYDHLKHGEAKLDLPADYVAKMTPIVEEQYQKAGVRLANLLVSALGS